MRPEPTRILLIGENDTLINNVRKIIPRVFGIDSCLPAVEEFSEKIEEYQPDIAILCLDLDLDMDLETYAEMSSLGMFDGMAVIALGQVDECRVFESRVFIKGVHMMQRPVKGSTLAVMLKTCERELEAKRGDEPAPEKKPLKETDGEPKRVYRTMRHEPGSSGEGMQRAGMEPMYEDEYEQRSREDERPHREPPEKDDRPETVVVRQRKKPDKRNSTPKLHHDDVLLIPPEGGRYFRNIVKEKQIRREVVHYEDDEYEGDEVKIPTHVSGKFSILVIDDDVQLLGAVRKYLQNDYYVTTVPSGRLAYKYLQVDVVDIILLDYMLRDEDGPTVLKNLRANPKTAEIPVIFLTGVSDKERVMNVLAMNPQGYLLKPIEKQELLNAIAKALE